MFKRKDTNGNIRTIILNVSIEWILVPKNTPYVGKVWKRSDIFYNFNTRWHTNALFSIILLPVFIYGLFSKNLRRSLESSYFDGVY